MTLAAVDAGISISTPLRPASTFALASRESVPPKPSSYPAAPPQRRISEKLESSTRWEFSARRLRCKIVSLEFLPYDRCVSTRKGCDHKR
jgi:hypothetical protein